MRYIVLVAMLISCEPISVQNGIDGEDGVDGINGLTNVVDASALECPMGGKKILSGSDTNRNSVLDVDEVKNSSVICSYNPPYPVTGIRNGKIKLSDGTFVKVSEEIPTSTFNDPGGGNIITMQPFYTTIRCVGSGTCASYKGGPGMINPPSIGEVGVTTGLYDNKIYFVEYSFDNTKGIVNTGFFGEVEGADTNCPGMGESDTVIFWSGCTPVFPVADVCFTCVENKRVYRNCFNACSGLVKTLIY